ncbi:MAG TPA: hypothetical protein VGA05_05780 [Candidatus Bathyarchaeia archaeon]
MTKNKIREGLLPPADRGVNDARPGLPTPTVRKNVIWVQPEPTRSDVTRPQQLSPDTTWATPSLQGQFVRGPRDIRWQSILLEPHSLVHEGHLPLDWP